MSQTTSPTATDPTAPTTATAVPYAAPAPRKSIFRRPIGIALIAAVLLAGIGGGIYYLYARQFEETDDAFVDGNIIPVAPKVAGLIAAVRVNDNQLVKAGDVLAEIDPRDVQARLDRATAMLAAAKADAEAATTNVALVRANTAAGLQQAEAGVASANAAVETSQSQLASAQADVTSAQAEATRREADEKRYTALDPRGVSQTQLDAARASADAARAQLLASQKRVNAAEAGVVESKAKVNAAEGVLAAAKTGDQQVAAADAKARTSAAQVGQAQASLDAAQLDLSYATIKAPTDGRVTRKNVQPGQYVQIGQTMLAVVPQDFWITANFKETQLTDMRVGQPVEIYVDAFPDQPFHGKVQSFQAGTGARFSLLPPENATGNFVKVVQRVPVKITFDGDPAARQALGVGMSVVPVVRVTGDASEPKTSVAAN